MDIKIITQPFDQFGDSQTFGNKVMEILSSTDNVFDHIWLISAWVNQTTIRRLYHSLEVLRDNGTQIHIYFGINFQGTYEEAIRSIYSLNVDSRVIYNPTYQSTFHPKIFIFQGPTISHVFIGSNNLTEGGLYRNYEATTWMCFSFPEDQAIYDDIIGQLSGFLEPNESIIANLNEDLIQLLIQENLVASRNEIFENRRRARIQEEEVESLNDDNPNPINDRQLPFQTVSIPNAPAIGETINNITHVPAEVDIIEFGDLVWRKRNLPSSDVQSQSGNPTGGLRLTQARFRVDNSIIDQTTYFRNTVFNNGNWATNQFPPLPRETIRITADLIILGLSYGIHELTVSHKPSGEANQGNYTTMLHWGHLGEIIRELNLVGKTFELYRTPNDPNIDFRIVIM